MLPLNCFGFDSKYLREAGFFNQILFNKYSSDDDEYAVNLTILRTMLNQTVML